MTYHAAIPIDEIPLLRVQLTKFACGGLGLGLAVSHILIDGQSALHFVTEWTKIARGGKCDEVPFFDRTVLQPRESPASEIIKHLVLRPPPLLIGLSDNLEEREKPTRITMIKISKEQVEKLKNKANMQGLENGSSHGFTKYEAICGHAWRCASKARKHTCEQETAFYIVVDFRNRLNPPLPKYFGNAIVNVPAIATAGDLLSKPLAYAAGRIRAAKEKVTDEYVKSHIICIKNLSDVSGQRLFHTVSCPQGSFLGNPNFTITNWVGLPTYGADFGWGKEFFMGPMGFGHDGRGILTPSAHGDGSFLLPLRLQVEHIDAFEKYFYEEI